MFQTILCPISHIEIVAIVLPPLLAKCNQECVDNGATLDCVFRHFSVVFNKLPITFPTEFHFPRQSVEVLNCVSKIAHTLCVHQVPRHVL